LSDDDIFVDANLVAPYTLSINYQMTM